MSTIDQQFVEYIVKTLVNNPDKVVVEREIDERGVLLLLTVDPEDIGRVIGRRGATAQSIRTLLRALGTKNDARYNLKIVDSDGGEHHSAEPHAASEDNSSESAEDFANPAAAAAPAEDDSAEDASEEPGNSLAEKTRAELADYDDLDI